MTTNDKQVNIYQKKFLAQQEITQEFLDYLRKLNTDLGKRIFTGGGTFRGGDLSSSLADTVDLSTPLEGFNGEGLDSILEPSQAVQIPFENATAIEYQIGVKPIRIPSEVERNVKTGLIEYRTFKEINGFKADPDSVVDDGDGTLTIIVDSVTEAGVTNAGRTVRVQMKPRQDGGALGPQTEATFFEELTVIWDGSNNKIETTTALGQIIGSISTDPNDYEVVLLGPIISRNTNLLLDESIIFLGKITGDNGNPPSTFDQSSRRVLSALSPGGGSGLLAQILTLLEEGGTVEHDAGTVGQVSWNADLKIRPLGDADVVTVTAANITLADDEVAYVVLPDPFVTATIAMSKTTRSDPVLLNPNSFWVFHRHGSLIQVRGGLQLEQGEKRQLDDIVIGNVIYFSDDDKIRYDDTGNAYHFDADGGVDNADIVTGTSHYFGAVGDDTRWFRDALSRLATPGNLRIEGGIVYAGAFANNDFLRFLDGGTPAWEVITDNVVRFIVDEFGDCKASRDLIAVRDTLTGAGTVYTKPSDSSVPAVAASLNEVWDQTLTRNLLKVTANGPADKAVNIAGTLQTLATGERFGLIQQSNLSGYSGGTVNFATGVVTGGGANFTPFSATANFFFKYGLVLAPDDTITVILPTGEAASAAAAPEPVMAGGLPVAIITVQDNGTGGSGNILDIDEGGVLRFGSAGGGGGSGVGGAQIEWLGVPGSAPVVNFEDAVRVALFESGGAQKLYAYIKIPEGHIATQQIKMRISIYSPSVVNTILIKSRAYLIRKDTDPLDFATNFHDSGNAAIANSGTSKAYREVELPLTGTDGKINSIAANPGDILRVELDRGVDTDTDKIRFVLLATATEVQF